MLVEFLVYALVAALSPALISGVRVKGLGAALLVSIVFAVLNILIGWLVITVVTILSIPFILGTFGLFLVLITSIANMILLKMTDALLEGFDIEGWMPAFLMGILFAIAAAIL